MPAGGIGVGAREIGYLFGQYKRLTGADAEALVDTDCIAVVESAIMPSSPEGIDVFQVVKTLYEPGKAGNTGGVATSRLEMAQMPPRSAGRSNRLMPGSKPLWPVSTRVSATPRLNSAHPTISCSVQTWPSSCVLQMP